MSERPLLQLQYCPGCDTYAPATATGAEVDAAMKMSRPTLAQWPFPALCSTCWGGLLGAAGTRDRAYLVAKASELAARIEANTARQKEGEP